MSAPAYESIRLDTRDFPQVTRRDSLERSSEADSDVSYRDNLDVEPFDEKVKDRGDVRFHDEPAMEEGEEGYSMQPRRLRARKKSRGTLVILISTVIFAALLGSLAGWSYSAPSYSIKGGNQHITMDHIFNGTFSPQSVSLDWVKQAPDGTFSHTNDNHSIILQHVSNMTSQTILVESENVKGPGGFPLRWTSWALSSDMQYVLFKTDHIKQWRHSSFGNFYVHRLSDSSTFPIKTPIYPATITRVIWSPVGHDLAFVDKNDLYIIEGRELEVERGNDAPSVLRITDDGSEVVFNGVPDWVYEEEVLETDSAMWWSPDGSSLAFLRSDEAKVRDYRLQFYNPTDDAFEVNQYTTELDMKYPKPGTPNPLVTVHTFSLREYKETGKVESNQIGWSGQMPLDERIITEVQWVGDGTLLVKETDRAARDGNVVIVEEGEAEGQVVRILGKNGEEGSHGWIDHGQNVHPVKGPMAGYLDVVPNEGFNHIAFFSPANSTDPIWITSGEWEVSQISRVDHERGIVYYMAANPSIDRHLYSALLPTSVTLDEYEQDFKVLTDDQRGGFYEVSFSPNAGYYLLSYKGPEVPWQRLIEVAEGGVDVPLVQNEALNQTLSEFVKPIITRSTLFSDGYELNMLQILPPNIDTSGRKKYPVLVRVYGGPNSQLVTNKFERDWHTYLACEQKYVIVIVDGRGTGFKGRDLRDPITDNLGGYEVVDQIAVAREMLTREYVDRKRIGIWGWSYGGYMTLKTIEADSGVFTLGMAVAPVTNWLYYDSIYTERYMSTPNVNPEGYLHSAVNNVTAFGKVDFLWAHGSGDDNVHYANTASLLDKLTQKHVRGWRFRMFTDSNHNMFTREANRELYEWMTSFLEEKWGRGGTVHHL